MKHILHLFYGLVREGKIVFEDRVAFDRTLANYEGKEVALTVKPTSMIRTSSENRYYWGVIVRMVAEEMGILPDEAHGYLKSLFLKVGVERGGKRWEIVRSTTALSIAEFEDFCESCREWASLELNTVIPLPNEVLVDV